MSDEFVEASKEKPLSVAIAAGKLMLEVHDLRAEVARLTRVNAELVALCARSINDTLDALDGADAAMLRDRAGWYSKDLSRLTQQGTNDGL